MSALSPENPSVFAAAALGRIDDERAGLKGDTRQATGDDGDFLAVVEAIRAEIDVASGHALGTGIVRGNYGERDNRLRDVVARLRQDFFAKGLDFGMSRAWAHQHAVAAGFAHALDDHLGKMGEDVREMVGAIAEIGLDGAEDGILVQIIINHGGNVCVDGFVVGDAVAGSVSESDIASAVGAHEAGHAEHGIGAEAERVEEVVVNAAINDVDAFEAVDCFGVDDHAIDDEVAAFDQFDAHLLGEETVLEISAVVDAGSEQDDLGVGLCARR